MSSIRGGIRECPQERVEGLAEALWQADSERAASRRRLSAWADESEETREQWRFMARAAIAATPTRDGWQDISTVPNDGRQIWVYGGRYGAPRLSDADGEWWNSPLCPPASRPTHWMPTPAPPVGSGRTLADATQRNSP